MIGCRENVVRPAIVFIAMAVPIPYLPIRAGAVLGLIIGLGTGFRRINTQLGHFALAAIIALWSGTVLGILGVIGGERIYIPHQAALIASTVLGFLGVVTLIMWCARSASPLMTLSAVAASLVVVPLTHADLWAANPWKFGLCWPATVLGLSTAQRYGRTWTGSVLCASAILSAILDTRSMLIFCAFSLLSLIMPFRHREMSAALVVRRLALVFAALWVVTSVGTQLALKGGLGKEIQEKTVWQETRGGSLIVSARAEIPTSIDLIRRQPWGYGLGVVPNLQDRIHSLEATVSRGNDESFALLGEPTVGTFRLHSQLADLWFFFGLGGFPLAFLIGRVIVRGVIAPPRLPNTSQEAMLVFLLSFSAWDFFFSPFENNYIMTAAMAGFLMVLRETHSAQRAHAIQEPDVEGRAAYDPGTPVGALSSN